jgi:hypothetical protein
MAWPQAELLAASTHLSTLNSSIALGAYMYYWLIFSVM